MTSTRVNDLVPPPAHPFASIGQILHGKPRLANQALLQSAGLELTYNGRGALLRACEEIAARHGKQQILLPAYHCPSGITPALHAGLSPVFYRIQRDLSIDLDDLNRKISNRTAAILVIHYFGIATDMRPFSEFRQRGIEVIEDWSHAFIDATGTHLSPCTSDYAIYSFWKLAPCSVGGALWRDAAHRQHDLTRASNITAAPLRERLANAKRMLETALSHSSHERTKRVFTWLEAMRTRRSEPRKEPNITEPTQEIGESHYPFDLALAQSGMPGLARQVLESTDLPSLTKQRRNNFEQYARLLAVNDGFKMLFPELPVQTCPWVFPVLLNNRNSIDHRWRADGVALHTFGIYLHSALFQHADAVSINDACYLAEHVLCLAIHQNVSTVQIENSAAAINRFNSAAAAASPAGT